MDEGVTTGNGTDPGTDATLTGPTPTGTGTPPPVDDAPDADAPDGFVAPGDAGADADAATPSDPSIGDPDTFAAGEYDVEEDIDTTDNAQRRPISPLIYGINSFDVSTIPAPVLKAVTFVRRGGDRVNSYDWETNLSTDSTEEGPVTSTSDYELLPNGITGAARTHPAALDIDMITRTRAANIGAMIPFVLNDYVAKIAADVIPWTTWTAKAGQRTGFYDRNLIGTTAWAANDEPALGDGVVYTDEHFAYLRSHIAADIYAPGPQRVLVAIDNEPDIYAGNYPYLQAGSGANLHPQAANKSNVVGTLVDGNQFLNEKFLPFAKRVKDLDPNAFIVGPTHYHYDGFTTWNVTMNAYSDKGDGKWFMEDFLKAVKTESDREGRRLLDVWDFHWYPQGTPPDAPDDSAYYAEYINPNNFSATSRPTKAEAIDWILQSPRSFWDDTYDENAWYTDADHTNGPAHILTRVQQRIDASYPGTPIGVSEYWPGGGGTIYNGLGVADILGIFQRMNVGLGAMWPDGDVTYAYGAFRLLRNADGNGLKFASTYVPVTNPATAAIEKAERARSSAYAASDDATKMTVLVINKTAAARRFALRAKHSSLLKTVTAYRIVEGQPVPVAQPADTLTKKNAYLYAAPAFSATLLVFEN